MKQSNIVDFNAYRERTEANDYQKDHPEDLITAIQKLIQRLRESDPIEESFSI